MVFLLSFSEAINIASSLITLINLVSYAILAVLISRRFKQLAYIATQNLSLLLLVLLAIASLFWSSNPDSTSDFLRGMIRATLLGFYLGARYPLKDQLTLLSWTLGIGAVLSLVVAIAFPETGTFFLNGRLTWQGIYIHKQFFGRLMAVGASLLILTGFKEQKFNLINWCRLGLFLILLAFSQSRTSFILLFSVLMLLPLQKVIIQRYKIRTFLLAVFLLFSFCFAAAILFNLETIVVDIMGKDMEFNGRIPVWTLSIQQGLERPLFGYGYGGFWTSDAAGLILRNTWGREALLDGTLFHAHNGFLDIFLQLGFVGLFLLIVNLTQVTNQVLSLVAATKSMEFYWMFSFLIMNLVWNLSEVVTFLGSNNLFWVLYVAVAVSSTVDYRQIFKLPVSNSSPPNKPNKLLSSSL
jgi:exopolysaccharide production protein ExoQ